MSIIFYCTALVSCYVIVTRFTSLHFAISSCLITYNMLLCMYILQLTTLRWGFEELCKGWARSSRSWGIAMS